MISPIEVSFRVGWFDVLYGGKKVAIFEYVTYDAPTVKSIDTKIENFDLLEDLDNSSSQSP